MPASSLTRRIALQAAALLALPGVAAAARFKARLDGFAAADQRLPSPDGALLFVGSSTIRLWPGLAAQFAPTPVVQRGFGGSTLAEVLDARSVLFAPHRPAAVVLYAGENDIAVGATPAVVVERYVRLRRLLATSPAGAVPWVFIGLKPSPARFRIWPAMLATNRAIAGLAGPAAPAGFVDTAALVLQPDGRPDPAVFISDQVHFNALGYAHLEVAVKRSLDTLVV